MPLDYVKRNGVGPTYWSPCQVTKCVENEVFEFAVGTDDVTVNNWGYRMEPDGTGTKVSEYFRLEPRLPLRLYWLLLGHLRGPGPHVRGCWAVDLVLGKS